jgi:uncharacterized protein YdaU (DUF1376 family)
MEVKKTVNEVVSDAKQVRSFWQKLFGTEPATPQPVAKKKEKFVAVDETQVMADIVAQLSEFFKLQEQLAEHIRQEEEKSKTVYDKWERCTVKCFRCEMLSRQNKTKQGRS